MSCQAMINKYMHNFMIYGCRRLSGLGLLTLPLPSQSIQRVPFQTGLYHEQSFGHKRVTERILSQNRKTIVSMK